MGLHKYIKTEDVKLDLVFIYFIILEPFWQIINIDRLILMYIIHITISLISYKPITMNLLSLEHKVE